MNYNILTKGRSHLHDLAIHLQNDSNFHKLITCWPKFKFKGVQKEKIESYFYIYFFHHFFSKYINIENILLKISCKKKFSEYSVIVDVNLAKYVYMNYSDLYLDHPTNSYFYQIQQWEYEEKITGVKIPRLQNLKKLYTQDEISNIYSMSKKIIVPSIAAINSFPTIYKDKLVYIPFWFPEIDNVFVKKQNSKDKDICFIGIICPSKGIHYLVEALTNIHFKGVLHLYGNILDENYKNILKKKSTYTIVFYGHITQNKLYESIKKMDLAVMPSVSEGLPLSYLQALSLGVPVIASEDSSLKEVIGSKYIYPTRDINALSVMLKDFFKNNEYIIDKKDENNKYTLNNYIQNWRKTIHE